MNTFIILIAAIELVAPANNSVVQLVPDNQKAVMSKATMAERIVLFEEDARNGKKIKHGEWRKSIPFKVKWTATAGENGPWEVLVGKKNDLSDARSFDFSASRKKGEKNFKFELKFINLEIATTYYWKVINHDKEDAESEVYNFTTEDFAPRWIQIEGRVGNFRDLGGRIGLKGKRVKQGMIYRSQGLNDNSSSGGRRKGRNRLFVEDVEYLTGVLGIKTDLDLRGSGETANMTTSPLGEKVKFINRSSKHYVRIFTDDGKKVMAENFRVFCNPANYPILFHCIAGADRTGALAYVLNGILGVKRQELETDWESTFYPTIPNLDKKGGLIWNSEQHFNNGFGKYGDENSSWNDRIVLYLKDCGITDDEIARFRGIMLED